MTAMVTFKALEGRDWDVRIDNPTSLPVWVRDAARVLKGHIVANTSSPRRSRSMPPTTSLRMRPLLLVAYNGDDPMAETVKSLNANPRLLRQVL